VPGTLDAIVALSEEGYLEKSDAADLSLSYRFLRSVESGLRLMNTTARHDLPDDEAELEKLAFLLGYGSGASIKEDCRKYTRENRERFARLFDEAAKEA
jgi:glutamate-ammonia-ligase adenylyltransferase